MQTWLSNPETNFGWLLISQGEGTAKTARHLARAKMPVTRPAW